ncbi:MAG: type IX secretion system membrane protein PorP/SprF [Lewinellaceae bacterium]|nr:type IX secretion system membrane protein PorP/SprF [Saprospiraceae bacterium]MCB9338237.1 type IX secretion system membrane protein PorP/SprF [Lewinellaceae bacterium]
MKNILTFALLLFALPFCFAQQPAQYSMYMFNKFAFNPAFAGLDNSISLTGVYRKQWAGIEGQPVTQNLNVHTPLYVAGGGIGLNLENESLGSWKQTSAQVAYGYQLQVGKIGVLSAGFGVGVVQRQLDGSKVRTPGTEVDDEGNPIQHNDPLLTVAKESGIAPNVNIGIYYQGEKIEAGISAINLLENKVTMNTLSFQLDRTYFFNAGYRFDLGKNITLRPSVLVKSNISQTQIDFSLITRYNENIFIGASFRGYQSESLDAVALIGGFKLNEKFTLGYSYDLTLSNLKAVSNGSHEIVINYNMGKQIGKGRPPKIIYNPRSL